MYRSMRALFLGGIFLFVVSCILPFGQVQEDLIIDKNDLTATALFSSGVFGSLTPAHGGTEFDIENLPSTETPILLPDITATSTPDMASSSTIIPTANPTAAPTIIYVPVNPTQPPIRPGGTVLADYFSRPPTIDGNWDDYNGLEHPISSIVFGYSNWTGEDDLIGAYRIGWDMNNLYLAVKVRDDVYAQNAAGDDLYKGDSIEVLLDADLYGDFSVNSLNADDYQLGISPGRSSVSGLKEAILWYPRAISGGRSFPVASMSSAGVYRVEMAIPWSVFSITPFAGQHYGFAVSISDNDDPLQNLQQTMVSSVPGRKLTLPMTWGELVLR